MVTKTSPSQELALVIEAVRLRAELALLVMLDQGFGYADPRLPAETYLRDDDARSRVFRLGLRPIGAHAEAAEKVAAQIAEVDSKDSRRPALDGLAERFGLDEGERAIFAVCAAYELDRVTRTQGVESTRPRACA